MVWILALLQSGVLYTTNVYIYGPFMFNVTWILSIKGKLKNKVWFTFFVGYTSGVFNIALNLKHYQKKLIEERNL